MATIHRSSISHVDVVEDVVKAFAAQHAFTVGSLDSPVLCRSAFPDWALLNPGDPAGQVRVWPNIYMGAVAIHVRPNHPKRVLPERPGYSLSEVMYPSSPDYIRTRLVERLTRACQTLGWLPEFKEHRPT